MRLYLKPTNCHFPQWRGPPGFAGTEVRAPSRCCSDGPPRLYTACTRVFSLPHKSAALRPLLICSGHCGSSLCLEHPVPGRSAARPLIPTRLCPTPHPTGATRTSQRSTARRPVAARPGPPPKPCWSPPRSPRYLRGTSGTVHWPARLSLRVCPPIGEMLREQESLSCADASSASGRCLAWGSGRSPHGTEATSTAAASQTWRFRCERPRARPWRATSASGPSLGREALSYTRFMQNSELWGHRLLPELCDGAGSQRSPAHGAGWKVGLQARRDAVTATGWTLAGLRNVTAIAGQKARLIPQNLRKAHWGEVKF